MAKHPAKSAANVPRTLDQSGHEIEAAPHGRGPFIRFEYSSTSITATGGRAHVQSTRTRFDGAKLTTERFDGELDRDAYGHAVGQAQNDFLRHGAAFLSLFSSILPFASRRRSDRD